MNKLRVILIILFTALLINPANFARAQTADVARAALEQELADVEKQIQDLTQQLNTTTGEKKTLTAKIKKLQTNQALLKLKIKSTALKLSDLGKKLTVTETDIAKNIAKTIKLRKDLAVLTKLLNQQDDVGILIPMFEAKGLAGAYDEYQNYTKLSSEVLAIVNELKQTKQDLALKQLILSGQREDTNHLLSIQSLQQTELVGQIIDENTLLAQTKSKELSIQAQKIEKEKQRTALRNRIYELFETVKVITFGQAVDIASGISAITGVRAPFLLAILTQESSLGKNVGTCNRAGDPPEKSWKVIMKPSRDQEPFKTITAELGIDIDTTPVSCPMKNKDGSQLGWGGAMGPAQFIPSTWMGYRAKVTALTGKATANPWDIRDAFAAAAIKLKADGANGTRQGEWNAAMRYFSGSTNTRYRFYGDNVMEVTAKYEADITDLNK